MSNSVHLAWPQTLADPTGQRQAKPRTSGKTMVIDKGLGLAAFHDLLQSSAAHIDMIKIGFGTAPLYPLHLLEKKIETAKEHGVSIYPGGTFLEVAIARDAVSDYFDMIVRLGFNSIEISDGTIEIDRSLRSDLINRAAGEGLRVVTEYGKKCWGSTLEIEELIETVHIDTSLGAEFVTIEGRESGTAVGIYDENGACRDEQVNAVMERLPTPNLIMWEAPQKSQQVHLLSLLGADINIGNVGSEDVMSLEALRRGLRSDTFSFGSR
jgi:phosphosulfolactate synthase